MAQVYLSLNMGSRPSKSMQITILNTQPHIVNNSEKGPTFVSQSFSSKSEPGLLGLGFLGFSLSIPAPAHRTSGCNEIGSRGTF